LKKNEISIINLNNKKIKISGFHQDYRRIEIRGEVGGEEECQGINKAA